MEEKNFLSPKEAANALGASVSSVYEKIKSGKIESVEKYRGLRKMRMIPIEVVNKIKQLQA